MVFFFFKQKTAYEMRISDWSSDVCSSDLGSVNPDDGFAMDWENYADKATQLKAITDEAKKADRLILATDPDREGEAISWHVQEVLAKRKALPKTVDRVTFNAITKQAVTEAIEAQHALHNALTNDTHAP